MNYYAISDKWPTNRTPQRHNASICGIIYTFLDFHFSSVTGVIAFLSLTLPIMFDYYLLAISLKKCRDRSFKSSFIIVIEVTIVRKSDMTLLCRVGIRYKDWT